MHVHMAFAGVINACYCPYGLRLVQRGIGFRAEAEDISAKAGAV